MWGKLDGGYWVLGLLKKFFISLSPVWAKWVSEGNQLTALLRLTF